MKVVDIRFIFFVDRLQRRTLSAENTNVAALVVGNPKLPTSITEHWGWADIPHAEQEANMVTEMLQAKSLIGLQATKESVLKQIGEAECVHLATHVSWKLSAIVLAPSSEPMETHKTLGEFSAVSKTIKRGRGSLVASTIDQFLFSRILIRANYHLYRNSYLRRVNCWYCDCRRVLL